MTTKLRTFIAGHWLGMVSALLIAGAVVLVLAERGPALPTITCGATNPGMHLGPGDGRVFVHPEGRDDEVVADGTLFEPIAIPPGRYDLRVVLSISSDRQSQWLRGINVETGQSAVRELAFSSGELAVDVTTGVSDDADGLVAYVYNEDDHDAIVASMEGAESALIREGHYDVRVVLTEMSEERDVRWVHGVEVEAGLRTKSSVAFHRGTFSLAMTNAGEALPVGAVTFNVHRAGDTQREVVDSGTAGVPLSLPVGSYDIEATFAASHDRPSIWLYEVAIEDDAASEHVVEFSSGAASVDAHLEGGKPLEEFSAYAYYYFSRDHQAAVAYTPLRGHAILAAGTYDVRVHFDRSHDQPNVWLRDVVVEPGEIANRTAVFPSGKLLVRAYERDGHELIGDNVFLDVYATGEHTRPITTGRSGAIIVLTSGDYDVRATDTRQPGRELWLHSVRVQSGALVERRLELVN